MAARAKRSRSAVSRNAKGAPIKDGYAVLSNFNRPGTRLRMDAALYRDMSKALLIVVPRSDEGVAFRRLPRLARRHLQAPLWRGRDLAWYATVVKLDLEARRWIERVPGSRPQRLRRRVVWV